MKCQQCEKPATFHITELTGGKPQELHLCEEVRADVSAPSARTRRPRCCRRWPACWPSNCRSARRPKSWPSSTSGPARCAASRFYEFRNQGRLGCPHDYVCFDEELSRCSSNIHGETQHVGKRPSAPSGADEQTELIRLRREMEEAKRRGVRAGGASFATRFARSNKNAQSRQAQRRPRSGRSGHAHGLTQRQASTSWPTTLRRMAARLRAASRTSSSPAASAWPATWPSFRSSPLHRRRPRGDREDPSRTRSTSCTTRASSTASLIYVDVSDLPTVDRQFLVERQLISRELPKRRGPRRGHRSAGDSSA